MAGRQTFVAMCVLSALALAYAAYVYLTWPTPHDDPVTGPTTSGWIYAMWFVGFGVINLALAFLLRHFEED